MGFESICKKKIDVLRSILIGGEGGGCFYISSSSFSKEETRTVEIREV